MVPDLFSIQKSEAAFEKTSAVGQVPDHVEFTGKVAEVSPTQAYDKTFTFTEYAAKIEIQRKLAADDHYRVMSKFPKGLSTSASRSREKLGAQLYELAFTFEPSDGDGAELCASDHGSNVTGVAAQSNEGTLALSATNVETTRLNMYNFQNDIGEKISVGPDTITIPRALEQTGWEIINTKGKVDTANNNANFHQGKYKLVVWDRLTDTSNWFLSDYSMQKEYQLWWNREPVQFFQDKDSNTMVAIYLSYYRVGIGWDDLILGHLKRGELLGTPNVKSRTISSQAGKGISRKVQRLEVEARPAGNTSMSALPRNRIKKFLDDIVWTAGKPAEAANKESLR